MVPTENGPSTGRPRNSFRSLGTAVIEVFGPYHLADTFCVGRVGAFAAPIGSGTDVMKKRCAAFA